MVRGSRKSGGACCRGQRGGDHCHGGHKTTQSGGDAHKRQCGSGRGHNHGYKMRGGDHCHGGHATTQIVTPKTVWVLDTDTKCVEVMPIEDSVVLAVRVNVVLEAKAKAKAEVEAEEKEDVLQEKWVVLERHTL